MGVDVVEERTLATVRSLIAARDWNELRSAITRLPLPDIAEMLADAGKADRALIYRTLPTELAADVAAYLDPDELHSLIQDLREPEARHLLSNLSPDDRTYFLGELPGQVTQRLLNLLGHEDLKEARGLLGYSEQSVGRMMTPDYIAVRPSWTVEQVLAHIRRRGSDSETISTLYVTDDGWKLLGVLDLRRVLLAEPAATVTEVMAHRAVRVEASDDREHALAVMQRHDLHALPVVDSHGVLLGIVTSDDMLDVAQTEATEDFHRTAAVSPIAGRYTEAGVKQLVAKRLGWLLGLILVNLMSSGVIAVFEETLSATIALVFFMPLLIDSGGNIGSQAATMMIRGIVTGDLRLSQWARTLAKEAVVGGALGLAMGAAAGLLGLYRGGYALALVVGLSMALLAVTANLVGAILPFVFTRIRVDPAVASSPLITTVADTLGLLIYFTVARYILG
ncbi:MAG TPA: magnesium transporter [Clostridiales bacterium]|nr:magnesium transporter [Clostridiales bacterium]